MAAGPAALRCAAAVAVLVGSLTACTDTPVRVADAGTGSVTAAPFTAAPFTAAPFTAAPFTAAPTGVSTALPTTELPTVTPVRTPPRPRSGPVFPQPPVRPGELARSYAGTESSGLPVDAVTLSADAVGGRDHVLSAGCAAAGTGVRMAFVFSVVARDDPTSSVRQQVDVPCDGRLHDAGVRAYVSGVVGVEVVVSPGTSPDYVALVRTRRAGDARVVASSVPTQPGSGPGLSVPAAERGEVARITGDTGPAYFTASRGWAVRVAAACVAGRRGAVAEWHIGAGGGAVPPVDTSGTPDGNVSDGNVSDGNGSDGNGSDGNGSDGEGSADTIASAVLTCDGRPHASTHTLVTTGEVSLSMDRDDAGDPTFLYVTVTAEVVAPVGPSATARPGVLPAVAPTAEAPGSRPTPVG